MTSRRSFFTPLCGLVWLWLLWLSQPVLQAAPPNGPNQRVKPAVFGADIFSTPPDPLNPDPFVFPIGTAFVGEVGTTGSSQFVGGTRWWYVDWDLRDSGWSEESDLEKVVVVVLPAPSGLSPGRTDVGSPSVVSVVNPVLTWNPVADADGYYVEVQVYENNSWKVLLEGPTPRFGDASFFSIPPGYIKPGLTYAWFVWTYNDNGVPSTTPAGRYFKTLNGLDVTKPTVSITSPKAGVAFATAAITVTGTASDTRGLAGVWISINGGSQIKATGTTNWTGDSALAAGTNVITAYSTDNSGNVSNPASVTVTYAPDTIPPTVLINQPTTGLTIESDTLSLSGTSADNQAVAAVEVQLNEGSWVPAEGVDAWSHSLTLGPGRHTIRVRSRDLAGTYSSVSSLVVSRRTAMPLIVSADHEGGKNAVLRFTGTPGMVYNIERSHDMLHWEATGTEVIGHAEVQPVTLPNEITPPHVFLRLVEQ